MGEELNESFSNSLVVDKVSRSICGSDSSKCGSESNVLVVLEDLLTKVLMQGVNETSISNNLDSILKNIVVGSLLLGLLRSNDLRPQLLALNLNSLIHLFELFDLGEELILAFDHLLLLFGDLLLILKKRLSSLNLI